MQVTEVSSELFFAFNECNFKPLVGDGDSSGHTGQSAADYERRRGDVENRRYQGFNESDLGNRHTDEVFCLFCCLGGLTSMNPGTLVADISHLEEMRIKACLA